MLRSTLSSFVGGRVRTPASTSSAVTLLARNIFYKHSSDSSTAFLCLVIRRHRWNTFSSGAPSAQLQQAVLVAPATSAFNSGGGGGGGGDSSSRWQRIARIIRSVRIPLLVISVYSLGYQQVCIIVHVLSLLILIRSRMLSCVVANGPFALSSIIYFLV